MSFAKSVVLLLSAFACVQALTTPHARDAHHHRALAARVAAPASNVAVPDVLPKKRDSRKRSSSKRCAARPAPSSNSTTVASSSSSEAASSSVPVNVGSVPTSIFTPPAPSSTPEPTPTPTPTHTPSSSKDTQPTTTPDNTPTSSSQAPAPTSPSSGSGSGSGAAGFLAGTNSGDGTFYAPGLGACGITNSPSDFICAVSEDLFDNYPGYNGANPNNNPVCGRQINVHYQGVSTTVTVTDRCTGCSETSLDFTPGVFDLLTNNDEALGRIQITWEWA